MNKLDLRLQIVLQSNNWDNSELKTKSKKELEAIYWRIKQKGNNNIKKHI